MKYLFFSIVITMSMFSCQADDKQVQPDVRNVDVCVYGGTSSGVMAAYSAKKMGKSVLLVEPGKYLGGMTTGGLGSTDIGNKFAVTGLSRLFYRKIGEHYNKFEQWTFPPSVATKVMNGFVKEAGFEVLKLSRITKAVVKNKKIEKIILENSLQPEDMPLIEVCAKQFIDCSYEGDLMARSGVSYAVGREDNEDYDETLNGVQMAFWHQFPDRVDPYIVEGDSTSGYCWGIQPNRLDEYGTGDKLIQAYNFRLCLTDVKENRRPFEKPDNYDPEKYELLARAVSKMDPDINNYLLTNWKMPENKYDVNNKGPLSTDMIGMNYEYPEGDYETRARIWQEHEDYTKGLLYFLTHDERLPKELKEKVSTLGWAKDEFVDNDNFPTQLYIREARRLKGEYVLTQKNCQGEEITGNVIGMAAYGMDSHNCQRIVVDGMVKNEGDVEYGGFPPYPIPYQSITPKREECVNLLVPVCVSSTHIAYGSLRMEPVFMVLGQSAGVASALAIDQDVNVQQVDIRELRKILKENPYLDGSTAEILVDDTDIDKISRQGAWTKNIGGYKFSYYTSSNKNKSSSYTFIPNVKKSGKYEIYFYCTTLSDSQMPETMAFDITCSSGVGQKEIAPQQNKGEWVSLGTYNFKKGFRNSKIEIVGARSDGPLFADAIIMVSRD